MDTPPAPLNPDSLPGPPRSAAVAAVEPGRFSGFGRWGRG